MPNSFYTLQVIDPTECMGDSVYKIRNNDFNASEAIGSLETRINTVSSNLITTVQNIQAAVKIAQGEYDFTPSTQITTINLSLSGFSPTGPLPFVIASIMDTNRAGIGGSTADRVIIVVNNITATSFRLEGYTSTDASGMLDSAPKVRWLAIQNNLPLI
jgi:hypothetical protein